MARPSAFRKSGGGMWNGTGTILDYYYTDVFPFGDGKPRPKSKTGFRSLYAVLKVQMDGAEKPQEKVLNVGSADDYTISADQKNIEGDSPIPGNFAWGGFISSLCAAGFDESRLPEDPTDNDYSAIIGTRVVFKEVTNAELTAKFGKVPGKNGKSFDRKDLTVDSVVEMPRVGGAKSRGASTPTPAASAGDADIDGLATETLVDVLSAAGAGIPKSKIKLRVFGVFGAKHPFRSQRDAVVARLEDVSFLNELVEGGVITFDTKSKEQTVALA